MSTAEDLLRATHAVAKPDDQATIDHILSVACEVRDCVQTLVSTVHERYALDHTHARDTARNAAKTLSTLVAERLVSRRAT